MRNKKTSKSSATRNKDGISLANIISIIGLVALGFFLYLGFAYGGTNTGTAILYAILITVGFALLLFAMLYAKKTEKDFKMWRIVEYTLLVVFIGVSVASLPILCRFINVNNESETLKSYAEEDINNLEAAIAEFQNQERANLSQLTVALQNVAATSNYHSATTDELKEYINSEILGEQNNRLTKGSILAFSEKWNYHIDNLHHYGDGKAYGLSFKTALDENRKIIQSWNIFEVPQAISDITRLNDEIASQLHSISESYPLHKIGRTGSQYDIVGNHQAFSVSTESKFKEECAKRTGMNAKGIILSIVIFILVIFNYVVAYRSTKVSVRAGSSMNDGGMILKV